MKSLIPALLLVFTSGAQAELLPIQGRETHGGNQILMEFWDIHNKATQTLKECNVAPTSLGGIFLTKKVQTEARTQPQVFIGTQEVIASNNSQQTPALILISESLWPRLDADQKKRIALHEILPVLGIDDTNYLQSQSLFNILSDCSRPDYTSGQYLAGVEQCSPEFIDSLQLRDLIAIKSATTPSYPANMAASAQCTKALEKIQSLGDPLNLCDENLSYPLRTALESFDNSERAREVINFFSKQTPKQISPACLISGKNGLACFTLRRKLKIYDQAPELLTLRSRLQCDTP